MTALVTVCSQKNVTAFWSPDLHSHIGKLTSVLHFLVGKCILVCGIWEFLQSIVWQVDKHPDNQSATTYCVLSYSLTVHGFPYVR